MTTIRTLMLLTAGLGAAALAGCGAAVPEHPTWQDDVRPIMVARCIRCHNASGDNGAGTMDPLSMPGIAVSGNFDYASFDDFSPIDKIHFAQATKQLTAGLMPPLPAAKLAGWQIETIENFVKDKFPPAQ